MDKEQQVNEKHEFIKDVHYYLENDRVIFTEQYHLQRGQCCDNNCRHCPYKNKQTDAGNTRTTK
jgi:2-iminoacetate synthase ThiH